MNRIAVIGSLNMDYIVETNQFPKTGETIIGSSFFKLPGGKGANQAVAAARLGGKVSMFGSLGNDSNGEILKEIITSEKIDSSHLQIIDGDVTGVAFIQVSNGNNRIVVIPGTNNYTNESYIKSLEHILAEFDVYIFQLETPIEVLQYLLPKLYQLGKITILNPAPSVKLDREIIDMVTYLTPNEHEVHEVLNSEESVESLTMRYPNKLIVTMGEKGIKYFNGKEYICVPAMKVNPVDTTGAGDTFSGAFAVALANGASLQNALIFANTAAGISTTKHGAQEGMPTKEEVEKMLVQKEGY